MYFNTESNARSWVNRQLGPQSSEEGQCPSDSGTSKGHRGAGCGVLKEGGDLASSQFPIIDQLTDDSSHPVVGTCGRQKTVHFQLLCLPPAPAENSCQRPLALNVGLGSQGALDKPVFSTYLISPADNTSERHWISMGVRSTKAL